MRTIWQHNDVCSGGDGGERGGYGDGNGYGDGGGYGDGDGEGSGFDHGFSRVHINELIGALHENELAK